MKIKDIKLKTYTLWAVNKASKDYNFILSVNANNLKTAKQFSRPQAIKLDRKYPHYHYNFVWEEDNV